MTIYFVGKSDLRLPFPVIEWKKIFVDGVEVSAAMTDAEIAKAAAAMAVVDGLLP